MTKKILIYHPSRGRPQQAKKIFDNIITNASPDHFITYALCLDEDDPTIPEYRATFYPQEESTEIWYSYSGLKIGPSTSSISAVNRLYDKTELARHDVFAIASDDIYFPKNWDVDIIALLDKHGYDKVIKTTNQFQGDLNLLNLQIGGTQFFIDYGTFYWPEYLTMFADNDMTMFAITHGRYIEARHLFFPHMQYSLSMPKEVTDIYGEIPKFDATYERENRSEAYTVGQQIFNRRMQEGFPAWRS